MAVADRKPFLLRIDPTILEAVQRWASEDLRSLNAQVEFLLRRVLQESGRMKPGPRGGSGPQSDSGEKG
jgi:hypothetical protein